MADITMCDDKKCKRKDTCYRFTAKPSTHWQSYFWETPRKDDKCNMYWDNLRLEEKSEQVVKANDTSSF